MDWRRGQFYAVLQELQRKGSIRISLDVLVQSREWYYKQCKNGDLVFTRNLFWGVGPDCIPGPVVQMAALHMPAVRELLARHDHELPDKVPITQDFETLVKKAPPVNHITFQPFTRAEWLLTLQTRANNAGQPEQPIKIPDNVDWPELTENGAPIKDGQAQMPAGSYAVAADKIREANQKASQS